MKVLPLLTRPHVSSSWSLDSAVGPALGELFSGSREAEVSLKASSAALMGPPVMASQPPMISSRRIMATATAISQVLRFSVDGGGSAQGGG